MARNVGPQCRMCRAEQTRLYLKGDRCNGPKCPITKKKGAPGKGPRARAGRVSDYGLQLRAKQRLRRMFGLLEAQFHGYFVRAARTKGKTGEDLIRRLESRLDNTVFRMHFASSRKAARQVVLHGHVTVNGRRVNIPSFRVKAGDAIQIREASRMLTVIKESLKELSRAGVVPWLEVDPDAMLGRVRAIPSRSEIQDLAGVNEQLIVELYSK
jgi:small subunit ribosomal protein S4